MTLEEAKRYFEENGYKFLRRTNNKRYETSKGDDYQYWRVRRGKLVQIPLYWVNRIATPQRIARRKSKHGQGKSFKRKCQR